MTSDVLGKIAKWRVLIIAHSIPISLWLRSPLQSSQVPEDFRTFLVRKASLLAPTRKWLAAIFFPTRRLVTRRSGDID